METMYDGSPMLAPGTYVRVVRGDLYDEHRTRVVIPRRTFIARVVGTDQGRSKYQVGERIGGWGRWLFADGGEWAFISQVTEISADEALEITQES